MNRGWRNKVHFIDDGDREFVRQVQLWLYFLVSGIEEENEELDAVMKLKTYLKDAESVQNISKACLQLTNSYFSTSFEKQMYRLCSRHYLGLWFGWVDETSFVESSNKSLQYMVGAPKITDDLHRAGSKMLHHTKVTHQLRQKEAVDQTQKSLATALSSNTTPNEASLSKDIINEVREKAIHEWSLSTNYRCYLADNGKQKSAGNDKQLVFHMEYAGPNPTTTNHCHPIYRRTRIITVSEIEFAGESHLCYQCSCHHLNSRKFCCRHIYRLLLRQPSKLDFLPECYKSYEVKYGVDMDYTGKVNELKHILHQCNGIIEKGSIEKWDLSRLNLQENDEHFISSPHQPVDVNPATTVASFNHTPVVQGDDHALKVRMSESALANLQTYPLYTMICEQVKTPADKEILREGLHEIFDKILMQQNKDKQKTPGGIGSTGNVTYSRTVYKRYKPRGSPTHPDRKKRRKSKPDTEKAGQL